MSAVIFATGFDWYCPNCNEGAGSFDDREDAELSAEAHDKEYHA